MKRPPVIHLGTFPGFNNQPAREKPFPWVDAVLFACTLGFILNATLQLI